MNETSLDVAKLLQEQERQWLLRNPPPPRPLPEPPTIHWTKLARADARSQLATEWNYYLTQVARLLAEGHEGRWVLIVREEVVGVYDTYPAAYRIYNERFAGKPVLLHQVLEREPILRGGGYHRQWRA
ncbi:MAG: hypothetical protein JNM56_11040 [Planctomycetia bacterium]|nr:hypothetical protein [Planctomycetia bacterium]